MVEVITPVVKRLEPDQAQRYIEVLRDADERYINDTFERFFAGYERRHGQQDSASL